MDINGDLPHRQSTAHELQMKTAVIMDMLFGKVTGNYAYSVKRSDKGCRVFIVLTSDFCSKTVERIMFKIASDFDLQHLETVLRHRLQLFKEC